MKMAEYLKDIPVNEKLRAREREFLFRLLDESRTSVQAAQEKVFKAYAWQYSSMAIFLMVTFLIPIDNGLNKLFGTEIDFELKIIVMILLFAFVFGITGMWTLRSIRKRNEAAKSLDRIWGITYEHYKSYPLSESPLINTLLEIKLEESRKILKKTLRL